MKIKFKKEYLPFVFMFVMLLLMHWNMNLMHNDDPYFARILGRQNLIHFLVKRYHTWSSRTLIEGLLVLIVRFELLWKAINIGLYFLIVYSLLKLIDVKEGFYRNFMCVILLMLYPYQDMSSAGWAATSTGYFWTISVGLYALQLLKKV